MFLLHWLIIEAVIALTKSVEFSQKFLLAVYASTAFLIIIWRITVIYLLKAYRKSGFNYRKVVIAGYSEVALELKGFFDQHPEHGYRFEGFFDNTQTGDSVLGRVEDIKDYVNNNQLHEIYCSIADLSSENLNDLIDFAENNLIRIKFLPQSSGFNYKKLKIDFYDHLPVLILRDIPLDNRINKIIKRSFDFSFSILVILLILSWLLPILAVLIKTNSKGYVFFKQKRSGINNDEFWCYKLRTMYVNDESHTKQATKTDSRITPIGRVLRSTSLDELPQFFNVLFGQMSVVGPRPHMLKHTEEYSSLIDKYMVRHLVKPGITGLSQVKGYRGETSSSAEMRNRVKIDIFYLENWTLLLDLKIILKTITNGIKGDEKAY